MIEHSWFHSRREEHGAWFGRDDLASYLTPGHPWADAVRSELPEGMQESAWCTALAVFALADTNATKTWTGQARTLLAEEPLTLEVARVVVGEFAALLARSPVPTRDGHGSLQMPQWRVQVQWTGIDMLVVGAQWVLALAGDPFAPDLLVRTARAARGVANEPGNLLGVASGAVRALAHGGWLRELAQLVAELTHRGVRGVAERALDKACAAAGVSPDQLRVVEVDPLGLGTDHAVRVPVGPATAHLVAGADRVDSWWTSAGRDRATVPPGLRRDHPEEVAAVAAHRKALRAGYAAERLRLERLMVTGGSQVAGDWSPRTGRHPLTGALAAALVWDVDGRPGIPVSEPVSGPVTGPVTFTDVDGSEFSVGELAPVRLTHPLELASAQLSAWRARFVRERRRQPFAQLFREVHHSGEDAPAHRGRVFAYHQADALLRGRGWRLPYRGNWDRGEVEFRAEYRRDGVRAGWILHELDSGGQKLRFVRAVGFELSTEKAGARAPVVVSELLRDLDLVAAVADLGRLDRWTLDSGGDSAADRVLDRAFGEQAFGGLDRAGELRREVVQLCLPVQGLAGHCRVEDHVLRVRTEDGWWSVHLGTAQLARDGEDRPRAPWAPAPAADGFVPTGDEIVVQVPRIAGALRRGERPPATDTR